MAERPAWTITNNRVQMKMFNFKWNSGFALIQKQKNIYNLHKEIYNSYLKNSLDISTKSNDELGVKLSAFNLKLKGIAIENIFQSSKVYEFGGPYMDLLNVEPKDAKRDIRHKTSGKLIAFNYNGYNWGIIPKTMFYDFIYINAAIKLISKEDINRLNNYEWFTDIEFNPNKSINCQARAVTILKLLNINNNFSIVDNIEKWICFHENNVK